MKTLRVLVLLVLSVGLMALGDLNKREADVTQVTLETLSVDAFISKKLRVSNIELRDWLATSVKSQALQLCFFSCRQSTVHAKYSKTFLILPYQ